MRARETGFQVVWYIFLQWKFDLMTSWSLVLRCVGRLAYGGASQIVTKQGRIDGKREKTIVDINRRIGGWGEECLKLR